MENESLYKLDYYSRSGFNKIDNRGAYRTKLYLSYVKEDEELVKDYVDLILDSYDAVIYLKNSDANINEEEHLFLIKNVNLAIILISKNYLEKGTFEYQKEYQTFVDNHIPILPILMEDSLTNDYKDKFDNLHYLSPNTTFYTYKEFVNKFIGYLKSQFVQDDDYAKITSKFDKKIFLSYRKKDRRHVKSLIKEIQNDEACYGVGIWYDEFLNPGYDFELAIKNKIDNSNIFMLVVTPNVINEKNYITEKEYWFVKDQPIVPVEEVDTDKNKLKEILTNIPDCIKEENVNQKIKELLKINKNKLSIDDKYYLGLGYLNGVGTEINKEVGGKLILEAANNGHIDALTKVIDMYSKGDGLPLNYDKEVEYGISLIKQLKKSLSKCDFTKTDRLYVDTLSNIINGYSKSIEMDKIDKKFLDDYLAVLEGWSGFKDKTSEETYHYNISLLYSLLISLLLGDRFHDNHHLISEYMKKNEDEVNYLVNVDRESYLDEYVFFNFLRNSYYLNLGEVDKIGDKAEEAYILSKKLVDDDIRNTNLLINTGVSLLSLIYLKNQDFNKILAVSNEILDITKPINKSNFDEEYLIYVLVYKMHAEAVTTKDIKAVNKITKELEKLYEENNQFDQFDIHVQICNALAFCYTRMGDEKKSKELERHINSLKNNISSIYSNMEGSFDKLIEQRYPNIGTYIIDENNVDQIAKIACQNVEKITDNEMILLLSNYAFTSHPLYKEKEKEFSKRLLEIIFEDGDLIDPLLHRDDSRGIIYNCVVNSDNPEDTFLSLYKFLYEKQLIKSLVDVNFYFSSLLRDVKLEDLQKSLQQIVLENIKDIKPFVLNEVVFKDAVSLLHLLDEILVDQNYFADVTNLEFACKLFDIANDYFRVLHDYNPISKLINSYASVSAKYFVAAYHLDDRKPLFHFYDLYFKFFDHFNSTEIKDPKLFKDYYYLTLVVNGVAANMKLCHPTILDRSVNITNKVEIIETPTIFKTFFASVDKKVLEIILSRFIHFIMVFVERRKLQNIIAFSLLYFILISEQHSYLLLKTYLDVYMMLNKTDSPYYLEMYLVSKLFLFFSMNRGESAFINLRYKSYFSDCDEDVVNKGSIDLLALRNISMYNPFFANTKVNNPEMAFSYFFSFMKIILLYLPKVESIELRNSIISNIMENIGYRIVFKLTYAYSFSPVGLTKMNEVFKDAFEKYDINQNGNYYPVLSTYLSNCYIRLASYKDSDLEIVKNDYLYLKEIYEKYESSYSEKFELKVTLTSLYFLLYIYNDILGLDNYDEDYNFYLDILIKMLPASDKNSRPLSYLTGYQGKAYEVSKNNAKINYFYQINNISIANKFNEVDCIDDFEYVIDQSSNYNVSNSNMIYLINEEIRYIKEAKINNFDSYKPILKKRYLELVNLYNKMGDEAESYKALLESRKY